MYTSLIRIRIGFQQSLFLFYSYSRNTRFHRRDLIDFQLGGQTTTERRGFLIEDILDLTTGTNRCSHYQKQSKLQKSDHQYPPGDEIDDLTVSFCCWIFFDLLVAKHQF